MKEPLNEHIRVDGFVISYLLWHREAATWYYHYFSGEKTGAL